MITLIHCAQCGKQMNRKPSQIKTCANSYCSKACHNASMMRGHTVECDWCGAETYKRPSNHFDHNFCNVQCRKAWFGKWTTEVLNVPGHSSGHKAPHLSILNQLRNPSCSLHQNQIYVHSSSYRPLVEESLGRKLKASEVVHHINGDRTDNRPSNLKVMSRSDHHRLHMQIAIRRINEGGVAQCQKTM